MGCSNTMLRYLIQKEFKVPTIECVVLSTEDIDLFTSYLKKRKLSSYLESFLMLSKSNKWMLICIHLHEESPRNLS